MIPPLLAAPAGNEINDVDEGCSSYDAVANMDGAVYKDGVWIALDAEAPTDDDAAEPDGRHSALRPQQSYYELLLARFRSLRTKLVESSFPVVDASASESHKKPDSRRAWLDTIDRGYPTSKHISQLDESDLFQALEACSVSLGRSTNLSREKSCWIWTLLALASDAGTLNNNLISKIRQLGLQAGRLGARLRQEAADQNHMDTGIEGDHRSDAFHDAPDCSIRDDTAHINVAKLLDCESPRSERNGHEQDGEADRQKPDATLAGEDDGNVQSLEQARARLLAQLGDRLVTSGGVPQEEEEEGEGEEGVAAQVSEESLEHEVPRHDATDWNTRATVDMILTVVAECYGQRDLLANRVAW